MGTTARKDATEETYGDGDGMIVGHGSGASVGSSEGAGVGTYLHLVHQISLKNGPFAPGRYDGLADGPGVGAGVGIGVGIGVGTGVVGAGVGASLCLAKLATLSYI